jgi:carbonic anhydrase
LPLPTSAAYTEPFESTATLWRKPAWVDLEDGRSALRVSGELEFAFGDRQSDEHRHEGGSFQPRTHALPPRRDGTLAAAMIRAREALERLREGNRRFVSDARRSDAVTGRARRDELASGQEPFAIIRGCSDSRVPAEIIFDQGLGDLFVIRVAGNIVASSQVGSVEFAAARYSTRLVVVLGHSQCGAVLATLEELQQPTVNQSRNLRSIVDRVRPSVEALLTTELRHQEHAAVFAVDTIECLGGSLPKAQQRLVEAWAEIHRAELQADWDLLQSGQPPVKIEPLR